MNTQPLVSIVMPSFNQSRFIGESIDSVLGQSYMNLELIVADGNSTDGTQAILEEIAKRDARLKWVSEPDTGPADAINKALQKTAGAIIGWLNSDDLYVMDSISHAVDMFAINSQAKLVYGEGEHVDAQGNKINTYPTGKPDLGLNGFHAGCYICQPTVFLRQDILKDIGLLDASLKTAFDFDYWLRAFKKYPENIFHTDKVMAYSRLHEDCITRTMRRKVAVESMQILARHVGTPQVHWFQTHVGEYLGTCAMSASRAEVFSYVGEMLEDIEPLCAPAEFMLLKRDVFQDARLKLYEPGLRFNIHPDAWASTSLQIEIGEVPAFSDHLILQCRHARPQYEPLLLKIETSWGYESSLQLDRPGDFRVLVPLTAVLGGADVIVTVGTDNAYIPSKKDALSEDQRELSFILDDIRIN